MSAFLYLFFLNYDVSGTFSVPFLKGILVKALVIMGIQNKPTSLPLLNNEALSIPHS